MAVGKEVASILNKGAHGKLLTVAAMRELEATCGYLSFIFIVFF